MRWKRFLGGAMNYPQDQINELKRLFGEGLKLVNESGYNFIYLPKQKIPGGVDTEVVDLLFCPTPWGGYNSRLFYSRQIRTSAGRNWNNVNVRIADQNWSAFSWQIPVGLTLAEMILAYLGAAK